MPDSDGNDGDLFADSDSDDTAELIGNVNKNRPAPAKKKPSTAAKKKKDAGNGSDSEDKGLFDSDSDDSDAAPKKKKAKPQITKKSSAAAPMSKKERLEALANRHKKEDTDQATKKKKDEPPKKKDTNKETKKDSGYDSGDSYDSGEFQRTAEDDDFIDTTGEDADAVNELYAEQHFDDDRPDDEERGGKKKKKRQVRYDSDDDHPDRVRLGKEDVVPDNPIMAAVHRMKKKKVEKKQLSEIEDQITVFLNRMDNAADEDERLVAEKQPAVRKLAMLNEVCDMLTKRDMQQMLLEHDLLSVCKRWIQPLPNGTLGNVTVRQRLLEVIGNMTGITATELKRSEFGKVVMILFKHRSETPSMKQKLKVLIEQWSRPIFKKSGNMRDLGDLERVSRGASGLAAYSRQQQIAEQQISKQAQKRNHPDSSSAAAIATNSRTPDDLNALITGTGTGGKKLEAGVNRVRVPYSKGFAFQVRPSARVEHSGGGGEKRGGSKGVAGERGTGADATNRTKLAKRMQDKGKTVGKNQRSANISVEGRATK